jgi:capsular polysaccharide transport system permease protein
VLSALVEPLATIAMLTLVFSAIRLRAPGSGDFVMLFLMSGVIPISTFKSSAAGADRAFITMRRALILPQLRPLDLITGGVLVRLVSFVTLFVLITLFFRLIYDTPEPEILILALVPLFGNALMGLGMGSINLVIKSWFPFWGIIFNIVTAPLGILSGIFFNASMLPPKIVDILYYNPFFHSTELCRQFFFPDYTSPMFDPYYYGGWVFGLLAVGLLCERFFRYRLGAGKG